MKQYLELLNDVVSNGVDSPDRTGTGTKSVFGRQIRFDLSEGFPLLTTKKMFMKGIIHELLWMLSGDTNVHYLQDNGVHIWDEWADERGDLGPVYGAQWRSWFVNDYTSVDQISDVMYALKNDPHSRRHVVSAWNVGDLNDMALSPCHCLFQFYVSDGKLSCQLYQRSADIFLGVPFNIASYALLTQMMAQCLDLGVGEFVHTFGDLHLYNNHLDQAYLQLCRHPKEEKPYVWINPWKKNLFSFEYEDFQLKNYDSWPAIKGEVSV